MSVGSDDDAICSLFSRFGLVDRHKGLLRDRKSFEKSLLKRTAHARRLSQTEMQTCVFRMKKFYDIHTV